MFPKRLIAIVLFASALAVMPPCMLRAQWVPTNSIHLGHVHTAVTDGKTIFDTYGGVLYRSTNNGKSWIRADSGLTSGGSLIETDGVHFFTFGGNSGFFVWSNDSLLWERLGSLQEDGPYAPYPTSFFDKDANLYVGTSGGIQRSTDGGRTWLVIDSGLPLLDYGNNDYITGFAAINSFLFVAMTQSPDGVYRSSDNGDTWTPVDSGFSDPSVDCLATHDGNLFAGTASNLYLSTDLGNTWKNIGTGFSGNQTNAIAFMGNTIFVGAWPGLYYSSDNGSTWQTPLSGLAQTVVTAFTPIGDTLFAGDQSGEFMSLDTGRTWTLLNEGVALYPPTAFLAKGDILYAADTWIYKSTDSGKNWNACANNWSVDSNHSMGGIFSFASLGPNLYASSYGVFLSTDGGNNWVTRSNGLPYDEVSIAAKGSTLFAGTSQNGIFLSRDSGASWVPCSNGLPAPLRINSLCATKKSVIVGTTYYGVYMSTDEGNSWVYHGTPTYDVATVAANDSLVFALGGSLYRSTVNDTTSTNIAPFSNDINAIVLIDSEVIIGTANGVFVSFDSGDTWMNQSAGLTNTSVESLAVFGSELVAGLSRDDGPSVPGIWRRPISEMAQPDQVLGVEGTANDTVFFGQIPIDSISLRIVTAFNSGKLPITIQPTQAPGNEFETSDLSIPVTLDTGESFTFEVYFRPTTPGSHSAQLNLASEAKQVTIYLVGIASGQADVENSNFQTGFPLNVNPNPFSQSTQISFTSVSAGYADISIVNLLGEQVARVFSGELNAGQHNFTFSNTADLPDGTYQCLLRMNGQVETLPIVLLH